MIIEKAKLEDLDQITQLYNWAITQTSATFDTEVKSVDKLISWFHEHKGKHPLFVAKEGNKVLGWGSLSKWSDRKAYDGTAELSIYINPTFHSQGIGKMIMKELIKEAKIQKLITIVSRITSESEKSIGLHKAFNFEMIGTMKSCGVKFGKVLDVHLMQLII